jgi:transposase
VGQLPRDFPPFERVHAFARRWQVQGLLTELHDRLRDRVRKKDGRTVDPSAAIVDSQLLRAAANIPKETSGRDCGKKVSGRKRHLVVDCIGLVLAVAVTPASAQDRDAAVGLLRAAAHVTLLRLPGRTAAMRAGSSPGRPRTSTSPLVEIVRRSDTATGFVVLPRRWVVERTLSWLMRPRRLVRDGRSHLIHDTPS